MRSHLLTSLLLGLSALGPVLARTADMPFPVSRRETGVSSASSAEAGGQEIEFVSVGSYGVNSTVKHNAVNSIDDYFHNDYPAADNGKKGLMEPVSPADDSWNERHPPFYQFPTECQISCSQTYVGAAHCMVPTPDSSIPPGFESIRIAGEAFNYDCICLTYSLFPRFSGGCLACIERVRGTDYPNFQEMKKVREFCLRESAPATPVFDAPASAGETFSMSKVFTANMPYATDDEPVVVGGEGSGTISGMPAATGAGYPVANTNLPYDTEEEEEEKKGKGSAVAGEAAGRKVGLGVWIVGVVVGGLLERMAHLGGSRAGICDIEVFLNGYRGIST
ncbi:hypothetical protein BJ508DRAFT_360218 [Ascobolus immersus RN42]|uniref:Uncharacterized protein n=1 Tax=Ascobolus immersus RN42 TaxID=1160509 RepID=A0A3N4IEL0_ASCIM|nr:hypothetical protein BJ508DRAFT_360218 [Ascobolus immersus RN42]